MDSDLMVVGGLKPLLYYAKVCVYPVKSENDLS